MLVLLALGCALALAAGVLVARAALSNRVHAVAQDVPGPVLLVPGYGGSTVGLDVLAAALRRQGRDASVVALPGDGRGDLQNQADVLAAAVNAALTSSQAGSVDVVGYSAGGVVARIWVKDLGGASQARRIVTLSSPHHGTDLAGFATDLTPSQCPAACRALEPDSDVLRALNAGDETPDGPLYVSISSTADRTVPAASSVLDGATNVSLQAVCPAARTTHGEMPSSPLVIAIVELELGTGQPVVPGTAQCRALSS